MPAAFQPQSGYLVKVENVKFNFKNFINSNFFSLPLLFSFSVTQKMAVLLNPLFLLYPFILIKFHLRALMAELLPSQQTWLSDPLLLDAVHQSVRNFFCLIKRILPLCFHCKHHHPSPQPEAPKPQTCKICHSILIMREWQHSLSTSSR